MSDPALFPPTAQRRASHDRLTIELAAAEQRVAAGSVTPTIDLEAFREELAGIDFLRPRPLDDVLAWTIAQLEQGLVHVTHPRYFGLFNPGPTFPSQCADRVVAAFNPQLATSKTSPAAVEIETHVMRRLALRLGLGADAAGHFTSGGSEANYTALLCALTHAESEFAVSGARAFAGAPVFYISRDSHLAWLKIAHQAGIGRAAARLVPTDGTGRMDPQALEELLRGDRAEGRIPVMIAATAGTTNAGMVDPLGTCAEIAASAGIWYHVDAAWGGALVTSDRLRSLLAGIEQAHSVTIDAHKWFATTMGCGMFLTRHPAALSAAFNVSTNFMPSHAPGVDPYVMTAQWSRRFLGLRLFLSLAAAGWAGYGRHVEHAVDLTQRLTGLLRAKGWAVLNQPLLAVACIQPPPGSRDVRAIVQRVLASGRAWVSVAVFEGSEIIRACVTHGETTPEDIAELVAALEEARC